MCVALIFPALCIYDRSLVRGTKNCCISCHCCRRMEAHDDSTDGEAAKPSCIRRALTSYYKIVHKLRWGLLLACVAGFIVTCIYAASLTLPTSSDVRLLDPDSSQFEVNYEWRVNLLSEVLLKQSGSRGYVIWGVKPADTGHHLNPGTSVCTVRLLAQITSDAWWKLMQLLGHNWYLMKALIPRQKRPR